ncbi:MAG: hypothetical protein ACXWIU_10735 [Limisphaerales bacterium]
MDWLLLRAKPTGFVATFVQVVELQREDYFRRRFLVKEWTRNGQVLTARFQRAARVNFHHFKERTDFGEHSPDLQRLIKPRV